MSLGSVEITIMPIIARIFLILSTVVLFAGCSVGRKNFDTAMHLEAEGRYDDAMFSYAEAVKANPDAPEYRLRFLAVKEKAAQAHAKKADQFFAAARYVEAMAEYQTAAGLDPAQMSYALKSDKAAKMRDAQIAFTEGQDLEKKNRIKDARASYSRALELAPDNIEFKNALRRLSSMRKSRLDGADLQLKSNRPITLRFRDARMKDVFNVITQLSGINFIFDEGIKDQNVTINLENATFYQALDLLTGMYKLGRKNLNETSVILYPKSVEKQKQYEEMVVRTYNLNNIDAKKAINLVRSMVMVKKIFVNDEVNALVFRDTREVVDVVEKILEANDMPSAEVLLDVEVVEVNDTDAKNLGLLLDKYSVSMAGFTPDGKMISPTLYTSTAPATAPVGMDQLVKAFSSKGFGGYVTMPSASYNFGKTLARGEILSNPKIRVKNKEKARFTVGQRVPFSTTSTQTSGVVSTNVQYVDVGVKVNAEPTIQVNNEVSIKLNLEVSSVVKKEAAIDGTTLVTIGTRNLETVLSLKDGETSVIGGLIQNTATDAQNKIFLLGDVPLLGPLVSNTDNKKEKTELVLAITPRLVRGVTIPASSVADFESGREEYPALGGQYAAFEQEPEYDASRNTPLGLPAQPQTAPKPFPLIRPLPPVKPVSGALESPPSVQPVPQPETKPVLSEPPSALPEDQTASRPLAPVVAESQSSVRDSLKAVANIGFMGPSSVSSGESLLIPVHISWGEQLSSAVFTVIYDPEYFEFQMASEGVFFRQDGKRTRFSSPARPGAVTVTVARAEGESGISGQGTLALLTFRARKPGKAPVFSLANITLNQKDGRHQKLLALGSSVEIR